MADIYLSEAEKTFIIHGIKVRSGKDIQDKFEIHVGNPDRGSPFHPFLSLPVALLQIHKRHSIDLCIYHIYPLFH